MAKPKLALIPAAQGSKLFSVLPSSGVGDFDFTRSGSATRINSQGLIETVANGQSRLNYPMIDGKVVGCPHHILEPQRTNLIAYSEDFNNSAWIKQAGITVSDNDIISPDGTQNADKITTTSGSLFMYDVLSLTPSTEYTISFFIKNDNSNKTRIWGAGEGSFDITWNGSQLVSITQGYFEYFGNGWYNVSVTQNSQSDGQYITRIYPNIESVTTNSIYLWGGQLEEGSYATSYIPTNGSTVTRNAETANGSGDADTFNDSEGVLMIEASSLVNSDTYRLISLNDNSSSNEIFVGFRFDTGKLYYNIDSGGVGQSSFISDVTALNTSCKFCVKYKQNDISFYINGFKLYSDSSANMPTGLSVLKMSRGNDTLHFYGNTKQIQYYNSALTDSELEQLTSWTSFSDMANGQLYTIE